MKTLITLLIAVLFATIAYPYGATTVTYRAIGLNFGTAIAGNFGLENGTFATWADVSDHAPP